MNERMRAAWGCTLQVWTQQGASERDPRSRAKLIIFKHDRKVVKRLDLDFCDGGRIGFWGLPSPPSDPLKNILPRLAVFLQKGTLTGTPRLSRESKFQFAYVHFLLRKRKRTKRNRPRPGALRFSQPAGPVELAGAQTATGPFSPAAAMLGPGRWDIKRRPQQSIGLRLASSKKPYPRG
jgi:hypothetical protein